MEICVGVGVATFVKTDGALRGSLATSRRPQHQTVVSTAIAQVRCPPAATAVADVISDGEYATARDVFPVPSCPAELSPVHHTAPLRTTHEWLDPSASDVSAGGLMTAGVFGGADDAGVVTSNSPQMDAITINEDVKERRRIMKSR